MKSKMVAESQWKPTVFIEHSSTSNSCGSLVFADFLCYPVEWKIERGTPESSCKNALLKSTGLALLTVRSLEKTLC